jgi:catechol 2,3-dioxygenase-like lactoylglutathione lyase family enzyme
MLVGLGHVDLVCRDLERSLAFYAYVLGPLGLSEPEEQEFELYAPGLHHVAFAVESHEDVDAAEGELIRARLPRGVPTMP